MQVQKSVENLLKESSADVNLDADESPYDTQSEFKMVKRFQPAQANDTFEGSSSDNIGVHPHQDLSKFKEKDANDMIDELVILAANVTLHASAEKLILSDPLELMTDVHKKVEKFVKKTLWMEMNDVKELIWKQINGVKECLTYCEVFKKANDEGEKWEKSNLEKAEAKHLFYITTQGACANSGEAINNENSLTK
ncbi:hypothetical protein Tco_1279283 [Tanacetum coccineum]